MEPFLASVTQFSLGICYHHQYLHQVPVRPGITPMASSWNRTPCWSVQFYNTDSRRWLTQVQYVVVHNHLSDMSELG